MTSSSSKHLIHCIIMIALTFGIGMLPPLGGDITPLGMKVLGVFIGVLYGWTFLGFFWISCYGMLALCLTGYDTIWNIMGTGFSNMIALQVLSLFILVQYLIESGFVEFVLGFFVTRKICIGRPFVLMFMIFFACAIVLMLGLGFGGVFFCWAIMYKMFDILGYKKGDFIVTYMIYGAAVSAGLSNAVFPFAVYPTMMYGFTSAVGHVISDIPWMVWNFLYVVVFFLLYIALGKYILRLDVSSFVENAEEVAAVYKSKKATKQQKLALGMMCLFLFVTLIPSFLPAGALKAFFAQFGMAGGVFLIIAITSIVQLDGKPVTDWARNAQRGINWDLLIMFVATTPIANALESADAGILSTIFAKVMPVLSEMSGHLFILAVVVFMLVITQFAHNLVVIMALSPTLFAIAASMGNVNISLLAACILISANAAFLTPGASSPAAAVFGNTDYVETSHAYKMSIMIILIAVLALALCYPLGCVML